MQINDFNQFRELTQQYGVIFYYSGIFTQNVIAAMGDALKAKFECQNQKGATLRKLFSTFVEMAQNVMHYSAVFLGEDADACEHCRTGSIAIGRNNEKYFILCGNLIEKPVVEKLNSKLAEIHSMSKEEIKKAYREQLHSETDADSQGAGLGFLTVARDSVEPIEYSFAEVEGAADGRAFFYIKATIG